MEINMNTNKSIKVIPFMELNHVRGGGTTLPKCSSSYSCYFSAKKNKTKAQKRLEPTKKNTTNVVDRASASTNTVSTLTF